MPPPFNRRDFVGTLALGPTVGTIGAWTGNAPVAVPRGGAAVEKTAAKANDRASVADAPNSYNQTGTGRL